MSGYELHRWNSDFVWVDHPPSEGPLGGAELEAFDREGFVVVPDLLEPEVVAGALAVMDAAESRGEQQLRQLPAGRFSISEAGAITFTTHLVARSEVLRALSVHPRILGLCAQLVGPDVRLYWDQAVYKKPEKPRRFPWHQDNGYTFVEPQAYLTVWIAFTDATEDNGCPQVATGLHRLGTLRHRFVDPLGFECFDHVDEPAVAEVKAGGAVVFSSLTPHLTGPNVTDSVRKSYILQYAPSGACVLRGDPHDGAPVDRVPCVEPSRQYEVLRGGQPLVPPPRAA
ncbi:MAG TPA: phytanoyl-CoA dioxygenase family protein [Acidimicrobiales bacterium]|nr:phytanoyl-CoA dioxygenase family protein [Acidimicrobiales bacterium]